MIAKIGHVLLNYAGGVLKAINVMSVLFYFGTGTESVEEESSK